MTLMTLVDNKSIGEIIYNECKEMFKTSIACGKQLREITWTTTWNKKKIAVCLFITTNELLKLLISTNKVISVGWFRPISKFIFKW